MTDSEPPAVPAALVPDLTGPALHGETATLLANAYALDDLTQERLSTVAAELADFAGPVLDEVRRRAGRVVWAMRRKMAAPGDYTSWLRAYAERFGVDSRTLRRWREAVIAEEGLALPEASVDRGQNVHSGPPPAETSHNRPIDWGLDAGRPDRTTVSYIVAGMRGPLDPATVADTITASELMVVENWAEQVKRAWQKRNSVATTATPAANGAVRPARKATIHADANRTHKPGCPCPMCSPIGAKK